jgi:hypothetical protein
MLYEEQLKRIVARELGLDPPEQRPPAPEARWARSTPHAFNAAQAEAKRISAMVRRFWHTGD